MAEPKSRPTAASIDAFIDAQPEARGADCRLQVRLMSRVTDELPVLWGPSLVGFGSYHYVYDSGREGNWPLTAFSPRKADLTLDLMDGFTQRGAMLKRLGPRRTGVSCLYLKSLNGIDLALLESMIADSVRVLRAQYKQRGPSAMRDARPQTPVRKRAEDPARPAARRRRPA